MLDYNTIMHKKSKLNNDVVIGKKCICKKPNKFNQLGHKTQ